MKILVDPPKGWQYGFPKVFDSEKDGTIEEFLIKHNYPVDKVPYVVQNCWCSEVPDDWEK